MPLSLTHTHTHTHTHTLILSLSYTYSHTHILSLSLFYFFSVAYNDVWLSVNSGVSWTLQTSAAQWSVRSDHSSVVVGSNIILMGGVGKCKNTL